MNITELERALEASRTLHWAVPPASARRRARRLPSETPVRRLSPDAYLVARPADVRSSTVLGEPETTFTSHSSENADISLALTVRGGFLQIEGRIWRADQDARAAEMEIVWVHGEHVLGRVLVGDGEMFRFEGAPVRGWTLEIALPGGRSLVLQDPSA